MKAKRLSREEIYSRLSEDGIDLESGIPRVQLNTIYSSREDWKDEQEVRENWKDAFEWEATEDGTRLPGHIIEQLDPYYFTEDNVILEQDYDELLNDIRQDIETKRNRDQFGWFETLVQVEELINHVQG